ncbi:hypothetical protein J4G37_07820 [Microvirga sp. 3-52]|nr:hypothetical protein [Microvirga sp. 3-52]
MRPAGASTHEHAVSPCTTGPAAHQGGNRPGGGETPRDVAFGNDTIQRYDPERRTSVREGSLADE